MTQNGAENGKKRITREYLPIITWVNFFYKQQLEFIHSDKWQTWFIGGNGTGKTHIVYWSVAAYALGVHPCQPAPPPIRVLCVEPDYDKVYDVALEKLLSNQIIMPDGIEVGPILPPSMIKNRYSKDHRSIDLNNNSQILFVTNEQGWQAMRGKQFDILALDEECSERVFDENLRGLRNAKGGGKVLAGLTPPYEEGSGPTWTKEKIVDASYDGKADIEVIFASMKDNPAITEKFIERFTFGKSQKQIDVQVYGKYPTWGDLVHPDFEEEYWDPDKVTGHLLPADTPVPENWEIDEWVMAFDWHPSKPCAAIWGYLDTDGNIVIFEELEPNVAEGKTPRDLSEIFFNIEGGRRKQRKFRRWQDPSAKAKSNVLIRGMNAWQIFKDLGIITAAGQNYDVQNVISIVNSYFRGNGTDHPRIFIYETCKNLIRGLTNHYWKRGEDGIGKPDPKWSDFPVCLKYIVNGVYRRNAAVYGKYRNVFPLQSFKPVEKRKKTVSLYHLERR